MAYTIYNTDGTVLSTIAVGDVDTFSTSLDLIGKNVNNYGEYYNTNLVRLLTSFASPENEEPRSPQTGQLWFNKTSKRLTVYDGSSFQPTYGSHVSGTAPITTSTGDFWYDTVNSQLKVWDGNSYNLVGPATSSLLGQFGILPPPGPIRDGTDPRPLNVGMISSYGKYIGLVSEQSFLMTPSSSTVYLAGTYLAGATTNINRGITLLQPLDVLGDIRINGQRVRTFPNIDLTATYDITKFGTSTATTTSTSFSYTNSNYISYAAANFEIAEFLARSFDYTNSVSFPIGSRASVICVFNTTTSVRKFELRKIYPQQNYPYWEPAEEYSYSFTATTTSTVGQVRWLWTATGYTNIVYPAWNEVIRTDSTSSALSGTYLDPITTGTTFYVKVSGGVPNTGFVISNPNPSTATNTLLPSGTFILDANGYWSTSSIITNAIQPVTTSVVYTYNFNFYATKLPNGTNHTRTLQFTGLRT